MILKEFNGIEESALSDMEGVTSVLKISLKGEISLLNCLLNDTKRIWWNSRVCSFRHEGSRWCYRYGQYLQQHWTHGMTKS